MCNRRYRVIIPVFYFILVFILFIVPVVADSSYDNKWAILIGVTNYQYVEGLLYPGNDVDDMYSVLTNNCGFPSSNIFTYKDSKATRSGIHNAITQLSYLSGNNDLVIFFFSGHGLGSGWLIDQAPYDESDGYDEIISPYDSSPYSFTYDITDDELQTWLSVIKSKNIICIIDTCGSGGMTKSGLKKNLTHPSISVNSLDIIQYDGFARDFTKDINGKKFVVLMAADDDEDSWDIYALQNGLFTYYLTQGLTKKDANIDNDGWISVEEAFNFAKIATTNYKSTQHPQILDGDVNTEVEVYPLPTLPTPTPTPTPVISLYEFTKQWGTLGYGQDQFYYPREIAVHPNKDRIYVSDTWNQRIQVFTKNGGYITSWGSPGSGNGQFRYPIGVAINEKLGRVYVSEENGNRIQIFTEDGGYISKWGTLGSGQGQFKNMREISVDIATGNVYVADTGNNRIQVFSSDGVFLRQIGTPGNGNGQLSAPSDVFIDQNTRKIYVTDQTNQRVQIFDENGGYSSQFGTAGIGTGQFTGPTGITLNNTGYAFVVDRGNYRIQVFSPAGNFVTGWGEYGIGPGQFNAPWGIGLDASNGYVYVGDSQNNRIQVFKPKYSVSPTPTSTTPTPTPTATTPTPTPTTQPTTSPPTTSPTPTPTSVTPTPTTLTPTPTQTNPTTLTPDFTASHISGAAPLTVRFQDTSQGNPTGWIWDINGDGFRDYSDKSFEHTYTSPGYYSVTFSVTRNQELATISRQNYIHVLEGTPASDTMTIDLYPGWNLLSTPKPLAEGHRTSGEAFTGINTEGHSTFRYNAQSQSWIQVNAHDEIEPLQGIWIYSATPAQVSLVFKGDQTSSPSTLLSQGWNAIGFSHTDPVSAKDALLPVQNAWTQVLGFNAASQFYETSIINGGSGTHSDTNLVYPGKGYWVFMNDQGTLS